MLVLTIRPMEDKLPRDADYILIDGRIKVYLVETKGRNVRLGIDAPKDVEILRRLHVEP